MGSMRSTQPLVWVLLGPRAGDNAQARELARQLGWRSIELQLDFNWSSNLPNWLRGAGVASLRDGAKAELRPPWPDLVIATGRRSAPVALAIKAKSEGKIRVVHLGRPRLPLRLFDLVLTTPQYGLPHDGNVVALPMPFAVPRPLTEGEQRQIAELWGHIPRPWTLAVIGAAKFPVRLGRAELAAFGMAVSALASRNGGGVMLLDSPRSAAGALLQVEAHLMCPHWGWQRGRGVNPYQAALRLCDQLVVTSDSVSMASEMVRMGKPVYIHRLPVSLLVPHWSAETGLGAALARSGILSPPRNVTAFMDALIAGGWAQDLNAPTTQTAAPIHDDAQANAVVRIKALVTASGRELRSAPGVDEPQD
jgi:mitochondrial fission protein ELM1